MSRSLPANHRWRGSQSTIRSSSRSDSRTGYVTSPVPPAWSTWLLATTSVVRGQEEPVETVSWKCQEIGQFPDWRELNTAHAFDRVDTLEAPQVELDGLRKTRQVVHT